MITLCFMIRDGKHVRELIGSFDPETTVLDALEILRSGRIVQSGGQTPVPAYRHSCHHGSCGTCGAIINGLEALMCLTRLGELASPRPRVPGGPKIEPELDTDGSVIVRLEHIRRGSLVAGIAARPTQALQGIPADLPYLMPVGAVAANGKANIPGGPPARVRFEDCIECGLCSSSCPVTVPFMGPAALAALNRQRQKRPETSESMLALAGRPDGAAACERHLACSRVCPQGIYPGKHIQLLKNALGGKS
ncbi:MAG: 2Fe-2S iron-sulfur cluster-binding protein [Spirochaetota bacterium]